MGIPAATTARMTEASHSANDVPDEAGCYNWSRNGCFEPLCTRDDVSEERCGINDARQDGWNAWDQVYIV